MNTKTSRPLYELRALSTGTIDSHATPSCVRHVRAGQRLRHRGQQIDHQAGEDAGQQAQRGEAEHRGERAAVDLARVARRRACAAGRGR